MLSVIVLLSTAFSTVSAGTDCPNPVPGMSLMNLGWNLYKFDITSWRSAWFAGDDEIVLRSNCTRSWTWSTSRQSYKFDQQDDVNTIVRQSGGATMSLPRYFTRYFDLVNIDILIGSD